MKWNYLKKNSKNLFQVMYIVDKIMHYIIKRKGKQIRPIFVFLSAKLLGKFLNHAIPPLLL